MGKGTRLDVEGASRGPKGPPPSPDLSRREEVASVKRRRRMPADKVREAVMGSGGFYQTITPKEPELACSVCGEKRSTVAKAGDVCAVCEVKQRAKARASA